jgi:hypothetical protein
MMFRTKVFTATFSLRLPLLRWEAAPYRVQATPGKNSRSNRDVSFPWLSDEKRRRPLWLCTLQPVSPLGSEHKEDVQLRPGVYHELLFTPNLIRKRENQWGPIDRLLVFLPPHGRFANKGEERRVRSWARTGTRHRLARCEIFLGNSPNMDNSCLQVHVAANEDVVLQREKHLRVGV